MKLLKGSPVIHRVLTTHRLNPRGDDGGSTGYDYAMNIEKYRLTLYGHKTLKRQRLLSDVLVKVLIMKPQY